MNGTPRLRSAFPSTPRSEQKSSAAANASPAPARGRTSPLPPMPTQSSNTADPDAPLIPFEIIEAPRQRLFVLAVYVGLTAWRLWDYFKLIEDDAESLWLFLKWALIDTIFIYGLPGMRIPWLEWSNATTTVLFALHALMDGLLMFRVPIPIEAWLIAFTKVLYDRELSVSERRVKPADILHNASLILGKQTIHILPEGSAMLNPDQTSFCLDNTHTSALLPIRINQTSPILIELLRFDLDSNQNETITIGAKLARAMKKQADKAHPRDDASSPRFLEYPVKKTGLYRLQRVVDESKLEVQRRMSDTLVVGCPQARIKATSPVKCKGELSDFALEVYGTPPLKIKYSRAINKEDRGFSFQSIQPENLVSPLAGQRTSGALVSRDNVDVSWARPEQIVVPLNESLSAAGSWIYSIDEVHDACGNVANYTRLNDDGDRVGQKGAHLDQLFSVHERPKASIGTQSSQCSLRVARGKSTAFPISIDPHTRDSDDAPYTLSYLFTPQDALRPDGEHAPDAKSEQMVLKNQRSQMTIQQPGLYSLKTISSHYCTGEVLEPSTCVLVNPPEPDLSISAENISDKCAQKSVGLLVALDLTGSPPFIVHYDIFDKTRGKAEAHAVRVDSLRHQLEFRPEEQGRYVYQFKSIKDQVYEARSLSANNLVLEQDVKPSAHAHFIQSSPRKLACIEEPVSFDVRLQGQGPWDLEYELVHRGRRTKHKVSGIDGEVFTINTDKLVNGGEYVLALTSVQETADCKIFLKEEAKIEVRQQRPKASFGQLEGKRSTLTLEGKKVILPMRLTGQAPWHVRYRNVDGRSAQEAVEKTLNHKNDMIEVGEHGTYELVDVHDAVCPGSVDASANKFEVRWIERPEIKVSEVASLDVVGDAYVKKDVCEGDEDTVEVSLTGTPPYHVKYRQRLTPPHGSASISNKEFTAGLAVATIRMETSHAGLLEYKFAELGDYLYDHDPRKHKPLIVQQRVNPKPSARFAAPGKTYKYCKEEEAGDEVIPISLQGTPPFHLEIGIKHHSSARPEIVRVPNIDRMQFDFRIPHRVLALGNHAVSVRNVRDAHGCQRKTEYDAPRVQVVVADVPVISPLESRRDYCVGDRISYALSGTPPFQVFYTFEGVGRKATSTATNFRRIAERPGNFTITALTDGASDCKAKMEMTKIIHGMPSVKISKGQETVVDIHEGGEAEILFEFEGTPPFEFTYTRSTYAKRGKKAEVQETKHATSYDHTMAIAASEEGTYEVVAIKDKFCAFSKQRADGKRTQKLLEL